MTDKLHRSPAAQLAPALEAHATCSTCGGFDGGCAAAAIVGERRGHGEQRDGGGRWAAATDQG